MSKIKKPARSLKELEDSKAILTKKGGKAPRIEKDVPQKLTSGEEFKKKIAQKIKMRKGNEETKKLIKSADDILGSKATKSAKKSSLAKKILKRLPGASSVISMLSGEDVTSALPFFGSIESAGPAKNSLSGIIEDPSRSPEERKRAIDELRKRSRKNKLTKTP